jgi:hypothetical protein
MALVTEYIPFWASFREMNSLSLHTALTTEEVVIYAARSGRFSLRGEWATLSREWACLGMARPQPEKAQTGRKYILRRFLTPLGSWFRSLEADLNFLSRVHLFSAWNILPFWLSYYWDYFTSIFLPQVADVSIFASISRKDWVLLGKEPLLHYDCFYMFASTLSGKSHNRECFIISYGDVGIPSCTMLTTVGWCYPIWFEGRLSLVNKSLRDALRRIQHTSDRTNKAHHQDSRPYMPLWYFCLGRWNLYWSIKFQWANWPSSPHGWDTPRLTPYGHSLENQTKTRTRI